MGKEIKFRNAEAKDYPEIASILDTSFSEQALEQRIASWAWRSEDNPIKDSRVPSFIVCDVENKLSGVHGLFPIKVKCGDSSWIAAGSCDFAVLPTARSLGLKLKLKALTATELAISTSANQDASKVTKAMGGLEVPGGDKRYIRVIEAGSFCSEIIEKKFPIFPKWFANHFLGPVTGGLINLCLAAYDWVCSLTFVDKNTEIEKIQKFGPDFDEFWKVERENYSFAFERSSDYLNWRYQSEHQQIEVYAARVAGKLVGYTVLGRQRDSKGKQELLVCELIAAKDWTRGYQTLLHFLLKKAKQTKADIVVIKNNQITGLLRQAGFLGREAGFSSYTAKANSKEVELKEALAGSVLISLGDGDLVCF